MFWLPLVSAKNSPRLMRPAISALAASRPLARAIAVARSTTSSNGVSDFLRVGGRRLHDGEEIRVLVDQRLVVGIEIGRRNFELVGPADPRRQRVGEVLVGAHHGDAGEIERLSRQVRQRLLRVDLRAALAQDGFEIADRLVVGIERIRLRLRECGRLTRCAGDETEMADVGRDERSDRVGCPVDGVGNGRRGRSPSARATRVVASAPGVTASMMRATAPAPAAARIDGNEMHRTLPAV